MERVKRISCRLTLVFLNLLVAVVVVRLLLLLFLSCRVFQRVELMIQLGQ